MITQVYITGRKLEVIKKAFFDSPYLLLKLMFHRGHVKVEVKVKFPRPTQSLSYYHGNAVDSTE